MKLTEIIMSHAFMKCPLCTETYRTKTNLRKHLNREHNETEAGKLIKRKRV